jgi:hypothetical protein
MVNTPNGEDFDDAISDDEDFVIMPLPNSYGIKSMNENIPIMTGMSSISVSPIQSQKSKYP